MIDVGAAPPSALGYIADKTGAVLTPAARGVMAVRKGEIVGMVAFDGWTDNSVVVHMAAEFPAVWRRLLPAACRYAFIQSGRGVVLGSVRASNVAALKLDMHFGFREIARVRDGYAVGDDMVLIEMRREECRWLGA